MRRESQMVKEKINGNLWKILVWVAGIIFGAGVLYQVVGTNCKQIVQNQQEIKRTKEEFIEFRSEMRSDIKYIKEGIGRIENGQ